MGLGLVRFYTSEWDNGCGMRGNGYELVGVT